VCEVEHLQKDKVAREQVLKYIKEIGSVTIKQVAEKFNMPYNVAKHAMHRLRKRKSIREVRKRDTLKLFSCC